MKDRKVLALILVLILVLSSFTFAFADTELPQEQDIEIPEVPENPDNLSEGIEVKAPSIKTFGGDLRVLSMTQSLFLDDGNNIPWDQPGSIQVDKYETPVDGTENQWMITLEVDGKNHATTSDIVLLIDRSGSMSGSKITAAENAAKSFVNQLMPDPTKTNVRIAVVSFAGGVSVDSGFKTAADKQDLIDAIDFTANGGTFIQAGLRQASALLSSSVADSKNIVLLGDGEATYSYGIDNPNDYLEFWRNSGFMNMRTDYRTTSDVSMSDFNYSSTVGAGTSTHTEYESGTWYRNYYRHGASSVAEAGFIKDSGHTIYTIALDTDTEGTSTLNNVASPGKSYTGSAGDLTSIYNSISAEIVYAAEDAVITDPLGAMFSIPGIDATNYNDHIHVSRGTVSWDNVTETITWNLGNITEVVATMWYIVELAPEASPDVDYPTNQSTYVDYTNINDEDATMYFPIPEVKITEGPPPSTGILTIEKEVWIDGVESTGNQTVFTFMVDGETVTASAIDAGTIELEVGSYVVTETAFGIYTPDATTLQAIVTTEGGLVTFVNRYTTPPPTDGTLIIDKIVTGNLSDETDVFGFNIYPQQVATLVVGYSVTASAITDGSIQLPEGSYLVVETEYGNYTPATTSQYVWVTAGQTTSVAFYNDWSIEAPTPGSILINKTVTGNRSDEEDVFTYNIEPYYFEFDNGPEAYAVQIPEFPLVVTASAVTDGYAGYLEPGFYLVTERDPSPYNLTARSSSSEYELYEDRGIIVYVNEDSQTVVNFTNRYNISTPSTTYRMSINKTADEAEVNVGDVITYTITVTNTGDGTLTNVAVVDDMVGLDEVITTLGVGASETFIVTYLATEVGLLENTATATDDRAPSVMDEALVFVVDGPPLGVPGLTIDKTVVAEPGQVFKPGDTIQFKIVVTNTGTEVLENILVEDVLAGFLQSIPSLDPGDSQEFIVSVTLAADFTNETLENIASATNSKTGTLQDTATVVVEEEEVVVVEEEEPPLAIPDTGTDASVFLYGAGAMLSLMGLLKKKRR